MTSAFEYFNEKISINNWTNVANSHWILSVEGIKEYVKLQIQEILYPSYLKAQNNLKFFFNNLGNSVALPNQTIQMQSTNFFNMNNFNHAIAPSSMYQRSYCNTQAPSWYQLCQNVTVHYMKVFKAACTCVTFQETEDKSKYTFKCYLSAFSKLMLKTLQINKE